MPRIDGPKGRGPLVTLLLLFIAACGPAASPLHPPGRGAKGDEGEAPSPSLPSILDGSFALRIETRARLLDHRDGVVTEAASGLRAVAHGAQVDGEVELTLTICELELPQLTDPPPRLPAEVVSGLADVPLSAALAPDGDAELRFVAQPFAIVVGAALADELDDPLPPDTLSPLIRDQDADGRPAVSVRAGLATVYMALRLRLALEARLALGGPWPAIAGSVEGFAFDWQVYGDNIPFFNAASLADPSAYEQLDGEGTFVLERRPGLAGCGELP